VVGGDATFGGGEIYPAGDNVPYPGTRENIFVGGTFTAPGYLVPRRTGGPCSGCLDTYFGDAQACYTTFQNELAANADNVDFVVEWSALILNCRSLNTQTYFVTVQASDLDDATYYITNNCNFQAEWVINVAGTADVTLHGGQFPAPSGGLVYNVLGSGRTINSATGVLGHILAPHNILNQASGVIEGKVVVADVTFSTQINHADCVDPSDVTIVTPVDAPASAGDDSLTVTYPAGLRTGDEVTIGDEEYIIASVSNNDDGTATLTFESALSSDVAAGSVVTATVPGNEARVLDETTSGAATLTFFAALAIFALLF